MMPQQFLKGSPFVILHLLKLAHKQGENPSQFDLAIASGYTPRTVNAAIRHLEKEGYITIGHKGRRLTYSVVETEV